MRGQLLEAESAAAGAVKEAAQLRQQLRSAQSRNQNQPADAAVLSRQTSSVFDQVMKETYEALKDEFQSNVVYKVHPECLVIYYQMLCTNRQATCCAFVACLAGAAIKSPKKAAQYMMS